MKLDAKESPANNELMGMAIFFLCTAPSMHLINYCIIGPLRGMRDLGFDVFLVEMISAVITLPLGVIFLLIFWAMQRKKVRSADLNWKSIFRWVGMSLLVVNALCVVGLWGTFDHQVRWN